MEKTIGKNDKNEIFLNGKLFKSIFVYSLPIIFSGVLQLLYNTADLVVCGKFGSEHSVGAISATSSLINLIINLFLGLSVGANILMARAIGEKNKEKGERVAYTSMVFSLIFGILVGAFGAGLSRYFLIWMDTPDDIIALSTDYLFIYFLGLPFSMIYNFGASLIRATGETRKPFFILLISGLFNVGFNLLFVIVFKLDVVGVALGTIISQGVSAILIVICLLLNKNFFEFKFKNIRFYKKEALDIFKVGLPAGIQGAIFSFSNVLIQSSINSLGSAVVDANGASSSLEGFIYTTMNSVAQTCVAFASANYGAGNYKRIKKTVLYSSIQAVLWGMVVGFIFYLLKNPLLSLYLDEDIEKIEIAKTRLTLICFTYFLCGLMDTFAFALRGIGYSLLPTIVSLIGACGFRILWIYTFFKLDSLHSLFGLALSYPISWVLTAGFHLMFFLILFSKKQKKYNKTLEDSLKKELAFES